MMNKRIIINVILPHIVFVCGLVFAEPASQKFASPAEVNVMKERLAKQLSLKDTRKVNSAEIRKLRRELAKNSIAAERNHVKSQLKNRDLLVQFHAIKDAAYVSGSDMIHALVEVLNDPSPGGRILSDFAVRAPRKVAAQELAKLIKNSPLPEKTAAFYTDSEIQNFLIWWKKNKHKYPINK